MEKNAMSTAQYPIMLSSNEEGGYIVQVRGIPEINSEIWDMNELQETAVDALISGAEIYLDYKKEPFPMPEKAQKEDTLIMLPMSVFSKILLRNLMLTLNIKPIDLANKMGIKPQEVNRIMSLRHNTKIDTVHLAVKALGKDFQLEIA